MEPAAPAPSARADDSAPVEPVPRIVHRSRRARPGFRFAGIALLLAAVGLAGWGLGYYPPYYANPGGSVGACGSGEVLAGEGASLLAPLMSQWERGYPSAYPGEALDYSPLGAGAGITALTERTVDFAATDEPLTSAEYAALPGPILTLPVAASALAIVYDLPGVSGRIALNGSTLAGIYLGTITQWDDPALQALNPGLPLPARAIQAVHRSDAAGTTEVLTDYLAQASPDWAAGPGVGIQPSWPSAPAERGLPGNSGLLSYVGSTPYSIGYADLPDVIGAGGVAYATMENPRGAFVVPDLASTSSAVADRVANSPLPAATGTWSNVSFVDAPGASDYPLVAMAYLIGYADAALVMPSLGAAVALGHFLTWVTGPGQASTGPLEYAPLPPSLQGIDSGAIATFHYRGSPLTACSPPG